MKRVSREKVQMYQLVKRTLEENQALWASVPQMTDAFQKLSAKIELIAIAVEKQRSYTVGVLPKRNKHKSDTLNLALQIAAALRAVAHDTKNPELFTLMSITRSAIFTCTQSETLSLLDRIMIQAGLHVNELADYGITSEMIDEFASRRDQLVVGIFAPREAILKRKDIGAIIEKHIKESEALLKDKIDGLMSTFETSQPDFFNSYKNARKVIHVVFHEKPEDGSEGAAEEGSF